MNIENSDNLNVLWESLQQELRRAIPASEFEAWFSNIGFENFADDKVTLRVPSEQYASQLEDKYFKQISKCIKDVFGMDVKLNYKFNSNINTVLIEDITAKFFSNLADYYGHENDLSNIVVALCNSHKSFRAHFLRFFFPEIKIEEVVSINREIWDTNGMGSRVDIYVLMANDEKYIIEVKKGDQNHHFGQYEVAFDVDKSHFGYITNYFCSEGLSKGYDVKTWREFYEYLHSIIPKSDNLITGFLNYLSKVCYIKTYNTLMNFNSLISIQQFFSTMDAIVEKASSTLGVATHNEKKGAWEYAYKAFWIEGHNGNDWTRAYFLLHYTSSQHISIGIPGTDYFPVNDIEKKAQKDVFQYSLAPYIDKDFWGYLWYDLSEKSIDDIQNANSVEDQERILSAYFSEVIESFRKYECK